MMRNIINIIKKTLIFLLLALPFSTIAQPITDITLVNSGMGYLEVRIRPSGDFDGFFAASVFTIRWNDSNISLGDVLTEVSPQIHYISESMSGVDGSYQYQIYAGFGNVPISNTGGMWTGGQEILLCTIPIPTNGGTIFEISDDDWTSDNNGSYFISFNGVAVGGGETGGIIYSITTSIDENIDLISIGISPNPTFDITWVEIFGQSGDPFNMSLIDATGRVVWFGNIVYENSKTPIDFSGLDEGIYLLKVESGNRIYYDHIMIMR